ncbi:iron-containing alcohol dehydrogenase [Bittarella massiliensis]|uniref:Alcohol dehydrogenase, class IV n=2 Tax=Clostridia TaxID=186801 RepID=A0AAQ1RVS6_9FIRM|nr:iron-containing alcohol dehydrogenase [Bittarella massiliensis (ex Durand et al. 2017)]MZL81777.1 iron-containing alcohol dehydrogenase [Bittarella massiliensis (ex Durand et al. 2017)]SHG03174.1 Alcohol dehydrogenase, class IV [Bittarella massiliensis (ex Durand et al. 2017)]
MMRSVNFYMPVQVYFESGCVLLHSQQLASLGDRALLVTGRSGAAKSGALEDVCTALKMHRVEWEAFSQVGENPLVSTCKRAGEAARAFGADFVVGIGGGSAMDAAKAASIFAANPQLDESALYDREWQTPALPVVCVPTTAGTSSELDQTAVLTIDEIGRKQSVGREDTFPRLALIDPKYTYSLPYRQTVSTAVDAFCHGVESYFAQNADGVSRMFALRGIELLYEGLCRLADAWEDSARGAAVEVQPQLRDQISEGCLCAGFSLNRCGTCFPHRLGYLLTERYGIPHGTASGAFLPAFIQRAKSCSRELFRPFLKALGEPDERAVCRLLQRFCRTGCTMTAQEVEGCRSRFEAVSNFHRTPGGYTADEAVELLRAMFVK